MRTLKDTEPPNKSFYSKTLPTINSCIITDLFRKCKYVVYE